MFPVFADVPMLETLAVELKASEREKEPLYAQSSIVPTGDG